MVKLTSIDPNKKHPYTKFQIDEQVELPDFDIEESNFNIYVLQMLSRIIQLEERKMGRMSGLRIFVRLDVSIYLEKKTGKHKYFVNEITRSHGAALFSKWDSKGQLHQLYTHMSKTLQIIASQKFYLPPPKLF
jgi:hypothetical protein